MNSSNTNQEVAQMQQEALQWQPNQADLDEIIRMYQNARSTDSQVQQDIFQKFAVIQEKDQFCNYLAIILNLNEENGVNAEIKQQALLALKNQIDQKYCKLPMHIMYYIQHKLETAFFDSNYNVRKTVGSVMSMIILRGGFHAWPGLLNFLADNLNFQDREITVVENSILAISIIVEDSTKLFEEDHYALTVEQMLNPVLNLLTLQEPKHDQIIANAINTVNMLLCTQCKVVKDKMDGYTSYLLEMKNNTENVRWRIVQGITTVLDLNYEIIIKYFQKVCDFMINALSERDQKIALSASEFWSGMVNVSFEEYENEKKEQLRPFLQRLLPILLQCCRFTDADQANIVHTKEGDVPNSEAQDQEDENDDDMEMGGINTTLRRSSAFTLEQFSKVYQLDTFRELQEHLTQHFSSQDALEKEAAILVFGAISDSDGCLEAVKQHLSESVLFLMQELNNSEALVRSTTVWTLSKFSEWIQDQQLEFFQNYMRSIIAVLNDPDQSTQEAACTSLSNMCESTSPELIFGMTKEILMAATQVIQVYQGGALITLFDFLGTLCQTLGELIRDNEIIELLMPLLSVKWNTLQDSDRLILPLFECFEQVVAAIGPRFEPYADSVYERCLKILLNVLREIYQSADNVYLQTDHYIRSMDLISAIFNAVTEQKSYMLVTQISVHFETTGRAENILSLLMYFLDQKDLLIKQYAFAVFGELQKIKDEASQKQMIDDDQAVIKIIGVATEHIFLSYQGLDPDSQMNMIRMSINALWCLGEIVVGPYSELSKPFLDKIVRLITDTFRVPKLNKSLAQNCAITLGRVGLIQPEVVGQVLNDVIKQWSLSLKYVKEEPERHQAYKGLCMVLPKNPEATALGFPYICNSLISYTDTSPELENIFVQIVQAFKNHCGSNWNSYIEKWPNSLKEQVRVRFNI